MNRLIMESREKQRLALCRNDGDQVIIGRGGPLRPPVFRFAPLLKWFRPTSLGAVRDPPLRKPPRITIKAQGGHAGPPLRSFTGSPSSQGRTGTGACVTAPRRRCHYEAVRLCSSFRSAMDSGFRRNDGSGQFRARRGFSTTPPRSALSLHKTRKCLH